MNKLKDLLIKVLNVIDYKGDKEVFSKEFCKKTYLLILNDIFKTKDEDKKKDFLNLLNSGADLDSLIEKLKDNMDRNKIDGIVKERISIVLKDYLTEIKPALNKTQLNDLQKVLC